MFQSSTQNWRKTGLGCCTTSSRFIIFIPQTWFVQVHYFHFLFNFDICSISYNVSAFCWLLVHFHHLSCCSEAWEPFQEQLVRSQVLFLWVPQPRQCDRPGKKSSSAPRNAWKWQNNLESTLTIFNRFFAKSLTKMKWGDATRHRTQFKI